MKASGAAILWMTEFPRTKALGHLVTTASSRPHAGRSGPGLSQKERAKTQGKDSTKIGDSMERGLTRRDFLKMSGAGLAGTTLLGGVACGGGFGGPIVEAAAAAATGNMH